MAKSSKGKSSSTENTGTATPKADESVQTPKDTSLDGPSSVASEKLTINGVHDGKTSQNPYIKEAEKRLAKLNKKKRGIENIEAKITSLTEKEKETTTLINQDERKKLAEKSQVYKHAQEYQDLLNNFASLAAVEEKSKITEKEALEAEVAAKVEQARKDGYAAGIKEQKEVLLTCFRFLRLAGYRRAMPDENAAENDAIEKVLIMVYSSEDSATAAIESLASSKEDAVEGSDGVTYARIKEIADTLYAADGEQAEPVAEEAATQTSQDLGESTVIVTDGDAEETQETQETSVEAAPVQTLTTAVEGLTSTAPAATNVDDAAANQAGQYTGQPAEHSESAEGWDTVNAGGQSWDNGAPANAAATSWADQSHEESATNQAGVATPGEEAFQEVPSRQGGRGRGFRGRDFRGGFRGNRGGFRARGDGYRGRGEWRGGERGGGYRGRGGGDRPYRPRGDRGGHDQPQAQTQTQTQTQAST